MAGVRDYWDGECTFAQPRGIPEKTSCRFDDSYYFFVPEQSDPCSCGEDHSVKRERAEKWVADGSSVWRDEKKRFVSDPDAHSESWLSTDEFAKCLRLYAFGTFLEQAKQLFTKPREFFQDLPYRRKWGFIHYDEYRAVLAAMRALEKEGKEARIVFYFDN